VIDLSTLPSDVAEDLRLYDVDGDGKIRWVCVVVCVYVSVCVSVCVVCVCMYVCVCVCVCILTYLPYTDILINPLPPTLHLPHTAYTPILHSLSEVVHGALEHQAQTKEVRLYAVSDNYL
jgi:hypothetical protein